MRVAVIKSNGHIDEKIKRILNFNKINGDFISNFNRNSLKIYDTVIFSYKNNIPNLPKVLESIVLEQKIFVIFVNNTVSTGEFYNILNNLYFSVINDQNFEIEFLSVLNNSLKYIRKINIYRIENEQLKTRIEMYTMINKAKHMLISKGFSEAESHKFIQRTAMDLRLSKFQAASLIIENKIDI